jgi:hydrogenase expression/formation protein HypD
MKYIDEYRNSALAQTLLHTIRREATQRWTLMEVCGGQTHSLLRYGIDEALQDVVELVHGPGCPVCVTSIQFIDAAVELAFRSDVFVTTFGDMLRVPGSTTSLAAARAEGAHVAMVYSPLDAVALAEKHPEKQIVFFAVGFETTTPATALAVLQAHHKQLTNFSLLTAHVRVQPAMELLMQSPNCRLHGFLAAGHVCTVLGYESYVAFCQRYRVPVVVTGFEPVDLLSGILACVRQLNRGEHQVLNAYGRSVQPVGNRSAQTIVEQVYEPCDREWRGMGLIPRGGFQLRAKYSAMDAQLRFGVAQRPLPECTMCRSGEIMSGKIKPPECAAFGRECTPATPLGAPMVSSEGACAAYYGYHRHTTLVKGTS